MCRGSSSLIVSWLYQYFKWLSQQRLFHYQLMTPKLRIIIGSSRKWPFLEESYLTCISSVSSTLLWASKALLRSHTKLKLELLAWEAKTEKIKIHLLQYFIFASNSIPPDHHIYISIYLSLSIGTFI